MNRFKLFAFVLAALAISYAAGGCSNESATQCSTDQECVNVFGVTAGQAVCSAGVCKRVPGPQPGFDAGTPDVITTTPCSTTKECVAANGGKPALCRGKPGSETCLPLVNDVVTEVTNNYANGETTGHPADPLLVGVFASEHIQTPEGIVESGFDIHFMNTVRFAANEWDIGLSGGFKINGQTRPLTAVYCDTLQSQDKINACFDHIVGTLKVPALLVRFKDDLQKILPRVLETKTFVYCSDCDSSEFIGEPLNGLVWFNAPAQVDQMKARNAWLADIQSKHGGPLKVSLVSNSTMRFSQTFHDKIEFNGKIGAEHAGAAGGADDGQLQWKNFDPSVPQDWLQFGRDVAAFKPDVVVVQGMGIMFDFYVLPEIEVSWPTGPARPQYFLGEDEGFEGPLQRSVGLANAPLRHRVTGVYSSVTDPTAPQDAPAGYDVNQAAFEAAFKADPTFGAEPELQAMPFVSSTGWESFYVSAYAIAAAVNSSTLTGGVVTGSDVASGMKQLFPQPGQATPPLRIDFGPSTIATGVHELAAHNPIDIVGTNAMLDFDPATGDVVTDWGVYCLQITHQGRIDIPEFWHYDATHAQMIDEPADPLSVCP